MQNNDFTVSCKGLVELSQFILIALLFMALYSCSGGSSDTDNGGLNATDGIFKGVFNDSLVEGLTYTINSVSKVTNKSGEFEYKTGDVIAFSIGNVFIGEATAKSIVTPLDLGYGIDSHELSNLLRLLQTLDEDSDPSNGISLNNDALNLASNILLPSLSVPSQDYESNENILMFIKQVADKDLLVNGAVAKQHFLDTLLLLNGSGYIATTDTDNDGVADNIDDFPSDPSETIDLDGNGVGDIADNTDDDLDGFANKIDNCPVDYNPKQEDIDKDMVGDACDKYLPIASSNHAYGVVIAELRSGGIYYDESLVENAVVVSGPGSMAKDYPIFDYDGPGIGTYRDCSVDHIDCTPTRDCTASHIDCTATRDCSNLRRNHDTRDCGGYKWYQAWDKARCESEKAAQNVIYDTDYAARKLDCERIKSSEKLICEVDKSAWKLDCERIKVSDKAACEVDKSLVKIDCERLKVTQEGVGEIWEVFIQESRKQAKSGNPRHIPEFIRTALEPFFDTALLDSILWTENHGNIFSVASKLATEIGKRGAVTLGDIIVFRYQESALYDIGLWAHELEHVKQYKLLGIDNFSEYYGDYWLETPIINRISEDFLKLSEAFNAKKYYDPQDVDNFVRISPDKIEALASVQSSYVCSVIDTDKSYLTADIFNNDGVIIKENRSVCRPN